MIGSTIFRTAVTSDSMAWAREHLDTAPHGSVFLVDHFLAAHGRQGRVWQVMDGQLMVTILLKPTVFVVDMLSTLNMALSLGVLDQFLTYGARLKWPNDILLQGKKMGGMLIEVVWDRGKPQAIIVGIGLNINTYFKQDDPLIHHAIGLAMVVGSQQNMATIQQDLFKHLNHWYNCWVRGDNDLLIAQWRQAQSLMGQKIMTHTKNGEVVVGEVRDFCSDGSLLLDVQGEMRMIHHYVIEGYQEL